MNESKRFWVKVEKTSGCWFWLGTKSKGYGLFWLDGQMQRAHRVSYEMHYGKIPGGKQVLHDCDTPPCVRPDHLYTGTHQDNMDDKVARGRQGHVGPPLSLTPTEVQKILSDPRSQRVIAAAHATSQRTVCRIKHDEYYV